MKPWRQTRHVRRARALDGIGRRRRVHGAGVAGEGIRLLAKSLAKTWGADGITAHSITLDPHAFLARGCSRYRSRQRAPRSAPRRVPMTPTTSHPSLSGWPAALLLHSSDRRWWSTAALDAGMTGLLADKVAIVTGAGQGVGEGIARASPMQARRS